MRKKGNNSIILALLVAGMFSAITGCKKEEAPAPSPPAPQKAAAAVKPPVQNQATSAKAAPGASPQFDLSAKKDPFKPFIQPKVEKAPVPSGKVSVAGVLPIQSYDVEQFKVSGVIAGFKENKALVVDPGGKGYVVKPGMAIGKNDGIITRITPEYIEVVEKFRDDNGKIRKRTIKLTLPKKS